MVHLIVLLYTPATAHKSAVNRLSAYIHMQAQLKMVGSVEHWNHEDVNVTVCKKKAKLNEAVQMDAMRYISEHKTGY